MNNNNFNNSNATSQSGSEDNCSNREKCCNRCECDKGCRCCGRWKKNNCDKDCGCCGCWKRNNCDKGCRCCDNSIRNKYDLDKFVENAKELVNKEIDVDKPFAKDPLGVGSTINSKDSIPDAVEDATSSFSDFVKKVNELKQPKTKDWMFLAVTIVMIMLLIILGFSLMKMSGFIRTSQSNQFSYQNSILDSCWTYLDSSATKSDVKKNKSEVKQDVDTQKRQGSLYDQRNDVSESTWKYIWPILVLVIIIIVSLTIVLCFYLRYYWKKSSLEQERVKSLQEHQQKLVNEYLNTQLDKERLRTTLIEKNFNLTQQRVLFPMEMAQREQDCYWKYKNKHLDLKSEYLHSFRDIFKSDR